MHKQVFFDQLEKFETGYIKQAKQADELIQKQKKTIASRHVRVIKSAEKIK